MPMSLSMFKRFFTKFSVFKAHSGFPLNREVEGEVYYLINGFWQNLLTRSCDIPPAKF